MRPDSPDKQNSNIFASGITERLYYYSLYFFIYFFYFRTKFGTHTLMDVKRDKLVEMALQIITGFSSDVSLLVF